MKDIFKIDSHKLIYHVKRVAQWLDGQLIYPIYIEISPSGTCNHRCSFCSVDFMGFKKRFLDKDTLMNQISEFARLGVKSIMFAGEGEPFLHKDLPEIIVHAKTSGIDVAMTTNGTLMRPGVTDTILDYVEWIKISINAGTAQTYSKIHNTQKADFARVLSNMEYAVKKRTVNNSKCTLGMQILLLEENSHEVETLAQLSRDMGMDYLVVKPYTRHHLNDHDLKIEYHKFNELESRLAQYNTSTFNVIFRTRAMGKWDKKDRKALSCHALPFWSYIDSGGSVWGCSAHLLEDQFNYGSIYKNTFKEIWEGEKRDSSLKWVASSLDINLCKTNCRMDEVNHYLAQLKDLPEHVNFI